MKILISILAIILVALITFLFCMGQTFDEHFLIQICLFAVLAILIISFYFVVIKLCSNQNKSKNVSEQQKKKARETVKIILGIILSLVVIIAITIAYNMNNTSDITTESETTTDIADSIAKLIDLIILVRVIRIAVRILVLFFIIRWIIKKICDYHAKRVAIEIENLREKSQNSSKNQNDERKP